jgi:molybdopterin molybdotransferase
MDGYALRAADWADGAVLPVSQRIPAGSSGHALAQALRGAHLHRRAHPARRRCRGDAGRLRGGGRRCAHQGPSPGPASRIRRRGEDVAAGAVVLRRGERLTPASLGLAASIGFDKLQVAPRVRVALFSTGDELVMPGEVAPADMKPGAIYNSNRFFLRALLLRLGCTVTDLGIVPDRLDATIAALKGAGEQHDLILTSGGVSVGEEDHIKPAVQALGELASGRSRSSRASPLPTARSAARTSSACRATRCPAL